MTLMLLMALFFALSVAMNVPFLMTMPWQWHRDTDLLIEALTPDKIVIVAKIIKADVLSAVGNTTSGASVF